MIDDKKIEEAARRNADKYRNYPTLSDEDRDKVSIGSFMDCAKWMQEEFLKNLWHPASEKPKERKENIIVLQDEDEEDEGNPLYASLVHERCNTFPWVEYCEDNDIYKWCYFKDLLTKKGRNHD